MSGATLPDQSIAGEPVSLSQRILNDIRERIVSREWPPGYRIPFEHELTVTYGCSRMTVNKALSQLAQSGLIERRRRLGSFVRQPRSQAAVLEIHDIRTEVEALGLDYSFAVLDRATRSGDDAEDERFGAAAPGRILSLTCLHSAGARPFCIEERLISLDAVPQADHETFEDVSPGPWLLSTVPWNAAEHRISAVAATTATADLLDIEDGAPCLVIERQTWMNEMPVTQARFTYPADTHSVVARFEPR